MDDVTVMTPAIQGTQWILSALEKMMTWAWMQFKLEKSRSLSIHNGQLTRKSFSIQGSEIPINPRPRDQMSWKKKQL